MKKICMVLIFFITLLACSCEKNIKMNKDNIIFKEISIEILDKYQPKIVEQKEGNIYSAQIIESNDIIYRENKYNTTKSAIKTLNIKKHEEKDLVNSNEGQLYFTININNVITVTSYNEKKEYIFSNSLNPTKYNRATMKFKINDNTFLVYDNNDFVIINDKNTVLLGYEEGQSYIFQSKIFTDVRNRIYCMYIPDVNIGIPDRNVKRIENGLVSDLISNVADFSLISGYLICINTFPEPDVPQIPQEGAYEEYSINVYDLDGKLIKNLDKDLYNKYGMIAYPESISVNSKGYGVMTGDFIYNYGKEDQRGFSGLIIFKLVDGN